MGVQVLIAYFAREVIARAAQFADLPLHEALSKAAAELRPEIEAALKAANLSENDFRQVMQAFS